MAEQLVEKFEKRIQEFERKREQFEREIGLIRDDIKKVIDSLFDNIIREVNPHTDDTDAVIETCIKEFKRLLNKRRELNTLKEKLSPMLEILQGPLV